MASNATRNPLFAETDFVKGDSDDLVLLGHPMTDSMMQMIIALGAEIWLGQQRARIMERLLAVHGKVTSQRIEQCVPTPEELATWGKARQAISRRVYRVMARNDVSARAMGSRHPNLDRRRRPAGGGCRQSRSERGSERPGGAALPGDDASSRGRSC